MGQLGQLCVLWQACAQARSVRLGVCGSGGLLDPLPVSPITCVGQNLTLPLSLSSAPLARAAWSCASSNSVGCSLTETCPGPSISCALRSKTGRTGRASRATSMRPGNMLRVPPVCGPCLRTARRLVLLELRAGSASGNRRSRNGCLKPRAANRTWRKRCMSTTHRGGRRVINSRAAT